MTLDDFEGLVAGLERGVVPAGLAARAAGPLYPLFSRAQLVRVLADQVYCYLDGRDWHPECAESVLDLLARCDRLADAPGGP